LGIDNFIFEATNLQGTAISTGDTIAYHDATDNNVKKGLVSDLPFTNNTGDMSSFTILGDNANTQTIVDGDTIDFSGGYGLEVDIAATDNVTVRILESDFGELTSLDVFGANDINNRDSFLVNDASATTHSKLKRILPKNINLSSFSNNIDGLGLESDSSGVLNIKFGGNENSVITSHDSAGNDGFTAESNLIYNGQYLAVVGGDVIAFASSDKRLKDNITPISNPIKKILQIGGYTFDWNENQNTYEGHDVGVIAQEVEKIMPQVVETRENGYKAVRYEKIVPLLIEAIKDQQKQIDELKNIIKNANK
jgi:hypothetical protein